MLQVGPRCLLQPAVWDALHSQEAVRGRRDVGARGQLSGPRPPALHQPLLNNPAAAARLTPHAGEGLGLNGGGCEGGRRATSDLGASSAGGGAEPGRHPRSPARRLSGGALGTCGQDLPQAPPVDLFPFRHYHIK